MIINTSPQPDKIRDVYQRLYQYNEQFVEQSQIIPLLLTLDDHSGYSFAGFIGTTWGQWLTIEALWVDQAWRSKGAGKQLLQAAEQQAMSRGCHFAITDTFDFQALDFYKKCGYQLQMTLQQKPIQHEQYWLTRSLG